jgi:hypothetical protein
VAPPLSGDPLVDQGLSPTSLESLAISRRFDGSLPLLQSSTVDPRRSLVDQGLASPGLHSLSVLCRFKRPVPLLPALLG